MEILKIEQEEQLLIKFSEIKHLILLKTQIMMDIKEVLPLWLVYKFSDKKPQVEQLDLCQISNL